MWDPLTRRKKKNDEKGCGTIANSSRIQQRLLRWFLRFFTPRGEVRIVNPLCRGGSSNGRDTSNELSGPRAENDRSNENYSIRVTLSAVS